MTLAAYQLIELRVQMIYQCCQSFQKMIYGNHILIDAPDIQNGLGVNTAQAAHRGDPLQFE
jgi:hypothetical protein